MQQERRPLRALARGPARLAGSLLAGLVVLGILAPATAAQAEPSIGQLDNQIEQDSIAVEKVIENYNKINEQLKASQAAAAALKVRMGALQGQLDRASAQVGELASLAYKGGDLVGMEYVLAAGSSADLVDRITSLDGLTRHQKAEVAQFAAVKKKHDAEASRLAKLVAQQQQQRDQLAAQKTKINADIARLEKLRRQAQARQAAARAPTRTTTSTGTRAAPPYVAGRAGVAVRFAYAQLGKPYVWGADGPGSYDCSGLTMAAWHAAGVSLPHNAEMQWHALPHISRSSLRPGDLVFYYNLGHVGIYVGSNQIIHAPHTGDVVRLASVDRATPYGYARPG